TGPVSPGTDPTQPPQRPRRRGTQKTLTTAAVRCNSGFDVFWRFPFHPKEVERAQGSALAQHRCPLEPQPVAARLDRPDPSLVECAEDGSQFRAALRHEEAVPEAARDIKVVGPVVVARSLAHEAPAVEVLLTQFGNDHQWPERVVRLVERLGLPAADDGA